MTVISNMRTFGEKIEDVVVVEQNNALVDIKLLFACYFCYSVSV